MKDKNYATHWRQAVPTPSRITEKSRVLFRNLFISAASFLNRSSEDTYLRCLYCHYVFDDQREVFERLIAELKKVGDFVDTDTCIQMLQKKKNIDKKYYHLSFDDGFRNNFINALPILRKHKVPAIFFVPSSRISANLEDTKNYCLNTTRYRAVIEMLKWNDIREMISDGYEVGSHTKTHARFSTISRNRHLLEDEILGSKQEIEANLDYECKYISWPFGRLTDADDESLKVVRDAGYTACFGAYRGTIRNESTDIFSIPRHHFEVNWPISYTKYFARGNMEVKI